MVDTQVTELKSEGLKKEFKISISSNHISKRMNELLNNYAGKVNIPGFRKGKIPINLVKQRYGDSAKAELLEELVEQSSRDLVKEKNINLASQPKVDVINFKEEEDFEFNLSLETMPEVTLPDFSVISLDKLVCEPSQEDIEEGLKRVAGNAKKFVKSDKKKAELKDAVLIDFEGKIDGIAFEGGKGTDFELELGSGRFIDGFESQLVNSTAGQKLTVNVTFPAQYGAKDLAGKDATFDVEVKEIRVATIPEINDEFAKEFNFQNVDEFKEKVKEQIIKDSEQASKSKIRKELFDQLEKMCQFPLPESMVENEFKTLWDRVKENSASPEFSNKSEDQLKTIYSNMAKRRVALGIVLAEVAKLNNITADQTELRNSIWEQARMFPGQEHAVVEFYRNNPRAVEQLRGPILEDKAVDYILGLSKVNEKKVSLKELIELSKITEEQFL